MNKLFSYSETTTKYRTSEVKTLKILNSYTNDKITQNKMIPMSADILTLEHFLLPGTLIVVDGRTANARFLKTNLQRDWDYYHSEEYDQHFFELKETPIGIYNQRQIEFCLGSELP